MENYDNFFNFNDQGRTPVYHTPDPVDPKDNKSGKKFTVITVPSWRMSWCSPA